MEKQIKNVTALFALGVLSIAVCLVMTIVTAIQQNRQKNEIVPHAIVTPALNS